MINYHKHNKEYGESPQWDCHDDKRKDPCKDFPNKGEFCVEEVLEAIHMAQKKAEKHDVCKTSCKESINELLGESKKPKKNTIPFLLYCGCEPFKATGVTTFTSRSKCKKFACITSYIFRIVDIDEHCAVLELLTFKPDKHSSEMGHDCKEICSPCCQIHCENVHDLMRTGICINIDLSCFCAITCLPAVCLKSVSC